MRADLPQVTTEALLFLALAEQNQALRKIKAVLAAVRIVAWVVLAAAVVEVWTAAVHSELVVLAAAAAVQVQTIIFSITVVPMVAMAVVAAGCKIVVIPV